MLPADRVLVLAPHTDDGELGCGGLIHKLVEQGADVTCVAFSSCDESLPDGFAPGTLIGECKAAGACLGVAQDKIQVLDHRVRRFQENRQAILDYMIRLRREIAPTLVLAPSSQDVHQDHQAIHSEAMRAFKSTTLLGYDLPWNNPTFDFDLVVGLSEQNLAAKIAAMGAYKSQGFRTYSQADSIRSIAKYHGIKSDLPLAECFEILRWIEP